MNSSKSIALAVLVVLLGLLAGCGQSTSPAPEGYTPPPQPSPQAGTTVVVQRGTLTETVEARGRVVSANEALLSFELEGVLTEVFADPGDLVSEGDLVAEMDITDRDGRTSDEQIADARYGVTIAQLNLQAAQQEAAIARAEAEVCQRDLDRAAARLSQAQFDYQRASYLVRPDKSPEQESDFTRAQRWALEFASLDYDKAVAACEAQDVEVQYQNVLVSLREQVLAHQQELLTRAENRAQKASLYAPFSGVIISWDTRIGERIEPYEPIGAIADPDVLSIEAWVKEEDIHKVAVGQPVTVMLDVRPGESHTGEVVNIAPEPTVWQGKNVYVVDIEFTDPEAVGAAMRTGADVVIETRRRIDVPLVPTAAIFSEDDHYYVEVVKGGGRVRVEVVPGISDEIHTEILTGLMGGEEVVVP